MPDSDDVMTVTCPYCGEVVDIYLEPDVMGMLVAGLRGVLQSLEDKGAWARRRAMA